VVIQKDLSEKQKLLLCSELNLLFHIDVIVSFSTRWKRCLSKSVHEVCFLKALESK
jgi:hypothetical protein